MEEEKEHMTTVATPPITTARLLSRHEITEGTMAFRFERPANWAFKAGQYLDMTLLDPSETDSEGSHHALSGKRHPGEVRHGGGMAWGAQRAWRSATR
jgi:hypothetical protein